MSADESRLDAIARSVSDDEAVDWGGEESGGEASVRALHDVARIAEFSRTLQRSPIPLFGDAAPRAPMEGPKRWGDLLLLEPVGAGAAGEVWRAWDAKLQRSVALKFLTAPGAGGNARLVDEARALARVRHANVATVHGIGEHDGRVGMWMEFLEGRTLEAEIERSGALSPSAVAHLGRELCAALDAVHEVRLVHGDLKPANVVLAPEGRVVLADFGLGQRRAAEGWDARRLSGTPVFMSPERLAGAPPTPRCDLYSLGVTLRFALTGRVPFAARTLAELEAEARKGPARPLREEAPLAPQSLASAITRAMAPEAGARFASAHEMAAALRSGGPREVRKHFRHPLALAAAALVVLAMAVVLVDRLPSRAPDAARAVPAAPAPAAYEVTATLVRRGERGFERLAPGDRVAPGDRLSLEFRATRPTWVYVLNEDERGESYLLFPQPLFDQVNPVAAESTAVLPGTVGGRENAWTVTSRGGREHFLVVASEAPVPEIEAELKKLPAATPGRPIRYASVAPATIDRLRGVGGVTPLPANETPRRAGAFDRFEALAGRERVSGGIWVRQITLENPAK